jgi:hypothetical protein
MRVKITVDEEEIRKLIVGLLADKSGVEVDPQAIVFHSPDNDEISASIDVDAADLHPVPN